MEEMFADIFQPNGRQNHEKLIKNSSPISVLLEKAI